MKKRNYIYINYNKDKIRINMDHNRNFAKFESFIATIFERDYRITGTLKSVGKGVTNYTN